MQAFNTGAGDSVTQANYVVHGVAGRVVSVRTDLGARVNAWQAAPTVTDNDKRFFCHGYAFRTSYHTFGAGYDYSLFGDSVPRVLADEYNSLGFLDQAQNVQQNDVVVWWSKEPYHSAIVDTPAFLGTGQLDGANTLVNSKTGGSVLRLRIPLDKVDTEDYPGHFRIELYRRA